MTTDNIKTDVVSPTEQVTESMGAIRSVVIDQTAKMATISPNIRPAITEFATGMLNTVSRFEDQVKAHGKGASDMLSAESLYRPLVSDASPSTGIVRLYQIINEYDKYLINAIESYEDEALRETEITLFRRLPFELDYINICGSNIGEVGTALKVALIGNVTKPCTLEQIIALRKVLDFIKKDISMREITILEILSILDDHFGLAGPLAEVDIIG